MGILANKLLQKWLAKQEYFPIASTPSLWKHKTRPIVFALVVNDFSIKFVGDKHAQHLLFALWETYKIKVDWKGSKFCDIDIDWYYNCKPPYINSLMKNYIPESLAKLQHPTSKLPQHQPHKCVPIKYGGKIQYVVTKTSLPLSKKDIKKVEEIPQITNIAAPAARIKKW